MLYPDSQLLNSDEGSGDESIWEREALGLIDHGGRSIHPNGKHVTRTDVLCLDDRDANRDQIADRLVGGIEGQGKRRRILLTVVSQLRGACTNACVMQGSPSTVTP